MADLTNKIVYFKGNRAKLTGKVDNYCGGVFHEAKMLEGSEKGEIRSISDRIVQNQISK